MFFWGVRKTKDVPPTKFDSTCNRVRPRITSAMVPVPSAPNVFVLMMTTRNIISMETTRVRKVLRILSNIGFGGGELYNYIIGMD